MDSRGINPSAQQDSDGAFSIPVNRADLTCPITLELFFDPVLAIPCGHGFEKSISQKISKCPLCQTAIKEFYPALDRRNMLDTVLSVYPELYTDIYFDRDHFAKIVRNNQLSTPTGERFIQLLQHSKKHLNDIAFDDAQTGKSAIEILAGTPGGRELIRRDEKIRALISEESLQIKVYGQKIQDWLNPENEEKEEEKQYRVGGIGLFANGYQRALPDVVDDTVWQRAAYGDENGSLEMIQADPNLVECKGNAIGWSGRIIEDTTPYQDALREGDEVLAEKIRAIYLQRNPENGQAILDEQFNEVFPEGFEAHLEEQKAAAAVFERDFIDPLVNAITNATPADCQAALDKQFDNGSELCNRLNRFREEFDALSHQEKVFNPCHLLKAFEKYNEKFIAWDVNQNNPHRWLRLDLFWRQVIGFEQRHLSANYVQGFCTGLGNIVEGKPLRRRFTLQDLDNIGATHFFPITSQNSCSGLGFDFAVYSCYAAEPAGGLARRAYLCRSTLFSRMMSNKNREMRKFMPEQLRAHRPRSRCIIL